MTPVRSARVLALTGLALGVAGLVGWGFDVAFLRSSVGRVAMNPMTAAALVGSGLATALAVWPPRSGAARAWAIALATVVAGLGVLRLLGDLRVIDVGMDRWLFPHAVAVRGNSRVSPLTALELVITGAAVACFTARRPRARGPAHALFLAAGLVALTALAGYLYGAAHVHGPMAFETALGFLALAGAGVCAEPAYGLAGLLRMPGAGGRMARLALPVGVLLPLVLAWTTMRSQEAGLLGKETGTALLVVAWIALLAPFLAWSAVRVERLEARSRMLFERSPVAAWVFDLETLRFLQVNNAAVAQYGYTREELLGMSITAIRPPEDVPTLHAALADQRAGRPTPRTWRHRRKDGSLLEVQISSHLLDYAGRPAELVLALDVTAERRYAARLEEANAELDAFAYSVSHDLRAPLRSIDGFARALEEDAGPQLDALARSHLARVRGAANRMAKLIDDLLGLSRITRAPLRRSRVDLSGIARSVADELAENGAARARWSIAPGVEAEGDPDLLRAALANLLGNAAKYSRPVEQPCIEFGAEPVDGATRYYVRDNGVGFDMAYAGQLFSPFQRLHSAQEFEGTGVGLATVARIVRRHGGNIWADSAPGRGTTFWFTLRNGGAT